MSKYGVFSGPYFPAFGLNTRKWELEKSPYLDTFHTVIFPEKYVNKVILHESPVPAKIQRWKKLDDYITEILKGKNKYSTVTFYFVLEKLQKCNSVTLRPFSGL